LHPKRLEERMTGMNRLGRMLVALGLLAFLVSPLACRPDQRPAAGTFRMTVFELKLHGLAIALETPSGAVYFVDTGKKEGEVDSGKDTLAPFLQSRGVRDIAGILISHPHHDHFEGASSLIKNFSVKCLVDAGTEGPLVPGGYSKLKEHAKARGVEVRSVHAGDTLSWDEALEVSVLAPPKAGVNSDEKDFLNNNSIVLRIRHGKNVFLLPGDLQHDGRNALMEAVDPEKLKATVLVAPHHGFFEGKKFAETVKPETVIVSCLADYTDKKLASPGDQATELFGAVGAKVYVTGWQGTVEVVSDGTTVAVKTARERK
jgi:competence protein ComEC